MPDPPPRETNRYSRLITRPLTRGISQAMLYAAGLTEEDMNKPQVGIASNWWEDRGGPAFRTTFYLRNPYLAQQNGKLPLNAKVMQLISAFIVFITLSDAGSVALHTGAHDSGGIKSVDSEPAIHSNAFLESVLKNINLIARTSKPPPGPVANLTAKVKEDGAINVSWTAPLDDGGSPITGYKIEDGYKRNESDDNPTWFKVFDHWHNTDIDLRGNKPGRRYYYRVSAVNADGVGAVSPVVSVIAPLFAPGAPTSLTATPDGATIINLSWTAPSSTEWRAPSNDGGSPITGYKIEASPNGNAPWTVLEDDTGSDSTSYAHTGLAPSTTRHYRVSAINSVGVGAASSVANATTAALSAPGVPTSLAATPAGRTTINLSWTAPSDGGAPITGYKIEASPNGNAPWTALEDDSGSAATSYAHTGLAPSTTRHYRVSAINSVGTGSPSNVANATTAALSAPGAPTSLTATPTGRTTINLSWTAPGDGGAPITGYKIEASPNGNASWTVLEDDTGSDLTSYANTGLAPSTTHHYRVSAINSVGVGAASSVANATTDAISAPGAPTSLTATPAGRTTINLSWTAPGDGGAPITGYKIEASPNGNAPWTTLEEDSGSAATSYAHTGLAPSTTRHYRVSAINSVGTGSPSNVANATTGAEPTSNAPPEALSLTGSVSNQRYPVGLPIADLVLPAATGGIAPYAYELTPATPAGLRFNPSSRTISGTPEQIAPPVSLTWKAMDATGAQSSLTFSIEVFSPVNTEEPSRLPQEFIVRAPYPNPFLHSTHLIFDLPWPAQVQVEVMDVAGRRLYARPATRLTAGWGQKMELNDLTLPSGPYLYRIIATSLEGNSASVHAGLFMSIR